MLNPLEATQRAIGYMQEIMPDLVQGHEIRLEEIESKSIETHDRAKLPIWDLTISVPDPEAGKVLGNLTPFGYKRVAKVITLNAEDGSLIAIKQYAA
jgi:hypothetical protein